jgi:hypothetical protein
MEFTLTYQGPLKTNGSARQKQSIRRFFHPQLKELWQHPPLNSFSGMLEENPKKETSILQNIGSYWFAPLVNTQLNNTAELKITFLRPSPPGSLITQSGDIDNRLKTLFDSLRMPQVETEIPNGDLPHESEKPFYCLLQDDALITKVSVETDRLLSSNEQSNYVFLLIKVRTKGLSSIWFNVLT